jgi:hypothetical protein
VNQQPYCRRRYSTKVQQPYQSQTTSDGPYRPNHPSDYFDDVERENHTREWGLPTGRLTPYAGAMWDKATTPNGVLGSKLM